MTADLNDLGLEALSAAMHGDAGVSELEALARRCEAANKPNEDLFAAIWRAVFPKPARIWESEDREEWTTEYENWQNRQHAFWTFMEAHAWLDAAMTLVPEGWAFGCGNRDYFGPWAWCSEHGDDFAAHIANAATPALALCAAALRARAAINSQQEAS